MAQRPEGKLSPPAFRPRMLDRVTAALRSGNWANGLRAREVERLFAERLGVDPERVVATNSATTAIRAFHDMNELSSIEPDVYNPNRLQVCPLTWPATYAASEYEPEWVDVDRDGFVSKDVHILVDLWGRRLRHLNERYRLIDCAHNVLAPEHSEYVEDGRPLVYSFAPQKEIPAPSGGMFVGNKWDAAEMRAQLSCGVVDRMYATPGGEKGLMDDVTAAIVRDGLLHLDERRAKRKELLAEYQRHLGDLLVTGPDCSGHLCIARAPNKKVRDHWRYVLKAAGIAWGHHYPLNNQQRAACPNAAAWSDTIITLPLHIGMNPASVRRVCLRLLTA